MTTPFIRKRRIEFRDTDCAGIAHFSTFFLFMEEVEHELLRHLGMSVVMQEMGSTLSWPRVHASCDYRGPVTFEDELDIEIYVERLGSKSVSYGFRFTANGRSIAMGQLVTVCCRIVANQPPQSSNSPTWIADKLQPYVLTPTQEPTSAVD